VVSGLVLVVVSLNAMVVNTTYRMTDAQAEVRTLQTRHDELEVEVARLSSPSRVAQWAELVGMVAPDPGGSVILRVPGGPADEREWGSGTA
jgi:cell division protein FtsL